MASNHRVQITLAFLLGIAVTFMAVLVFTPRNGVEAQATASSNGMVGISATPAVGGGNYLWLVNARSDTPRLCLYEWSGNRLKLNAARNITYDFMFDQYPSRSGSHDPSVRDVFKETSKQRKDSKDKK
jgi:hypothetical protein